jgi:hypothetical protein
VKLLRHWLYSPLLGPDLFFGVNRQDSLDGDEPVARRPSPTDVHGIRTYHLIIRPGEEKLRNETSESITFWEDLGQGSNC